jgi:sulfur carrier protein
VISLKVKIVGGKISERNIEINPKETYEDLLKLLGINPETVVILSDSSPVPIDDVICPGEIEVIRVVSTD